MTPLSPQHAVGRSVPHLNGCAPSPHGLAGGACPSPSRQRTNSHERTAHVLVPALAVASPPIYPNACAPFRPVGARVARLSIIGSGHRPSAPQRSGRCMGSLVSRYCRGIATPRLVLPLSCLRLTGAAMSAAKWCSEGRSADCHRATGPDEIAALNITPAAGAAQADSAALPVNSPGRQALAGAFRG